LFARDRFLWCPYRKPKWLTIACESGDIRCYGRCL
jgi:hypothetical protein